MESHSEIKGKFNVTIHKLERVKTKVNIKWHSLVLTNVSAIKNPKDCSLIFSNKWNNEIEENLMKVNNCLIILPSKGINPESKLFDKHCIITVENPRLEYAIILSDILSITQKKRKYSKYKEDVTIGENVRIGLNCCIEPQVFIDHDVTIGDNCVIKSGVRIRSNVTIGNNSIIRENTVIGGWGFGIERDGDRTIRIPHIGGVIIGENVEIGALCTVVSGTIEPTVIDDYVKTDDHVHIAHNCKIGEACLITACSEISGSVTIGRKCWLGPNCSIMNGIYIGDNVFIGLGAVVTKDVQENSVVAGNPAKLIMK